jgi:hypothetical protein
MSNLNAATDRAAGQRIFPLHLSPIETFMLADDQPAYPMTFVIQLQLSGSIDHGPWEAALADALQRHPLLAALIKTGKGDLPCWMPAIDQPPEVHWGAEGTPIVCPDDERIDLARESGLRVWVRQGEQRATVVLLFHHACCDGTGAYRFIGDLLAGYGIRTAAADQRPELGSVEAKLLRTRKQRCLGPATGTWPLTRLAIQEAWKILTARPRPLEPPVSASGPRDRNPDFPGFLSFSFDRAGHQRLRDVAGRCGVTLNDLLLRDLFLCLERSPRQQRPGRRKGWLRIMMPNDLREVDDYALPATNMTGYTFLARAVRDCALPEELLRSIRDETAMIKHRRGGTRFIDTVFAASHVPRLLPFVLARNLCLATALLSNAADPSRRFSARFPRREGRIVCGNLVLDEITGVAPLRRNTRASFSISQYDRRLSISLRCDPHLFQREDAAALLGLYVQRLKESAGLPPG